MAPGISAYLPTHTGLPWSRVSSSASSSRLASMRSAIFHSSRARCAPVMSRQPGDSKAARAAATARSTSAASPAGMLASTSPVAGLSVSRRRPDRASTQSAPMSMRRLPSARKRRAPAVCGSIRAISSDTFRTSVTCRACCGCSPSPASCGRACGARGRSPRHPRWECGFRGSAGTTRRSPRAWPTRRP